MRLVLAPELPLSLMQRWAVDAEATGIWTQHRSEVFPLPMLPERHLEDICIAVAEERKPPYWLDFGIAQLPNRSWYEWHWQRGIDPDRDRRRAMPAALRAFIIDRDGLVCGICTLQVERRDVHIDHIHPVSRGGTNDPDNLRVTHSRCNIRKGAKV